MCLYYHIRTRFHEKKTLQIMKPLWDSKAINKKLQHLRGWRQAGIIILNTCYALGYLSAPLRPILIHSAKKYVHFNGRRERQQKTLSRINKEIKLFNQKYLFSSLNCWWPRWMKSTRVYHHHHSYMFFYVSRSLYYLCWYVMRFKLQREENKRHENSIIFFFPFL